MTLEVENSRYPKTKFLSQQAQLSDYSGPVCLLESAMTNQYEDEFPQTTKADHMDQSYVRSAATTLTFIVCCALALRLLVVASKFLSVAAPSPDHGQFGAEMGWVARSLASGQGFSSPFFPMSGPTALVPPLFPYLLSQIFRAFGIYTAKSALVILSLDSLFSALTCVPIYLSLKYAAGERPAQMAAWLWAIYPFAVYFSGAEVWDYALTSLLFACCFCFAQRLHLQHSFWAWSGFGALYGIATLSNPSVLSMFPFLLLTALWRVRQVGGPWLLRGLITTVALTVIVVPWAVRNERMMHAPSPVRDGFWLEFWAGNSGDNLHVESGLGTSCQQSCRNAEIRSRRGDSLPRSQAHLGSGLRAQTPLLLCGCLSTPRYSLLDWILELKNGIFADRTTDIPNVFFCTCITFFMIRGMWRCWKEARSHAILFLSPLIIFPLPYYLTHSSMDYRQPIEPQIVMLVTLGLFGFRDWNGSESVESVEVSRTYESEAQMA